MLDVLIAKFAQPMLYLVAVVAALTFYLDGMVIVATGAAHWLPLGMLVLSPLMMLLLRIGFEGSFDWSFFDPRVMSWSFVVGDVLLLPLALWFAGLLVAGALVFRSRGSRTSPGTRTSTSTTPPRRRWSYGPCRPVPTSSS